MDEMTLTLNSPITEEQWDAITDIDFEHTNEITFHTKHGKEVKFVKASAQPEDYTEMKQEFLRMASYIDVLLECSDVQKETLMGFISRLAEFMPWTERD